MLKDRHIVLGVTGGIAAYKACDLVSRLKKQGAQVRVVLTANAAKFVKWWNMISAAQCTNINNFR